MATLTVRGVPERVVQALKAKAEEDHRSMNAEVVVALEVVAGDYLARQRQAQALEELGEIRRRVGPMPAHLPDTTTLIREGRER